MKRANIEEAPSTSLLLKVFHLFEKHGLIRDDLCFDPEHFMDTVIRPHWFDCDTPGIDAGDEVIIEFWGYANPLNGSIATFIRTNTETGTKMAIVIDELGQEKKAPMFNKILRKESENKGRLVEVKNSLFWGPLDRGTTFAKIVCACEIPSLNKKGYLVKHYKDIKGERFVENKDITFIEQS